MPQSRRDQRRVEAEARSALSAKRKPIESRMRDLEKKMDELSRTKAALEKLLSSPDIYDDARKAQLREHLQTQAELGKRLDAAEAQWLELSDQLDQLQSDTVDPGTGRL
jgi:ATP-binding cassette subfamily F protein 3